MLTLLYLLTVTLSLSPNIMLFGVRSLWTILFSLCKYRRAKHSLKRQRWNKFYFPQQTHNHWRPLHTPLTHSLDLPRFTEKCNEGKAYLNKYFPQSFFSKMELFFLQRTEMLSKGGPFYKLHNYIQPIIYTGKTRKRQ